MFHALLRFFFKYILLNFEFILFVAFDYFKHVAKGLKFVKNVCSAHCDFWKIFYIIEVYFDLSNTNKIG